MTRLIKAITLQRPWPWAIFHLGKDIENRGWRPRNIQPGDPLLIHAGQGWDRDGLNYLNQVCNVPSKKQHATGLIGLVVFNGCVESSDSPWFFGPIGWQISDPRPLPRAIYCKGRLGVWVPPAKCVSTAHALLFPNSNSEKDSSSLIDY